MPIPIATAIWAAVSGAVGIEVADVIKTRVKKSLDEHWRDYLNAALDDLGIVIDPEKGITDETLTAAVNQNLLAGTGLELASLLDKQKMMDGFKATAMRKMAEELGLPPVNSVTEIRAALQAWLVDQVGAELAAEAGELIDAAKPLQKIQARIAGDKPPRSNWNDPVDFTPEGISNRERQARYRASHTKVWIPR